MRASETLAGVRLFAHEQTFQCQQLREVEGCISQACWRKWWCNKVAGCPCAARQLSSGRGSAANGHAEVARTAGLRSCSCEDMHLDRKKLYRMHCEEADTFRRCNGTRWSRGARPAIMRTGIAVERRTCGAWRLAPACCAAFYGARAFVPSSHGETVDDRRGAPGRRRATWPEAKAQGLLGCHQPEL